MAVSRNEVLVKRAVQILSREHGVKPEEILYDYNRSDVEEFDGSEYVVLRDDAEILAVFLVDEWQVERLEPENWPDYLLEETEQEVTS
jgi:hypothetical protein